MTFVATKMLECVPDFSFQFRRSLSTPDQYYVSMKAKYVIWISTALFIAISVLGYPALRNTLINSLIKGFKIV